MKSSPESALGLPIFAAILVGAVGLILSGCATLAAPFCGSTGAPDVTVTPRPAQGDRDAAAPAAAAQPPENANAPATTRAPAADVGGTAVANAAPAAAPATPPAEKSPPRIVHPPRPRISPAPPAAAPPAQPATAAAEPRDVPIGPQPVTTLLGQKVALAGGPDLGRIVDVLVTGEGRARAAVIDVGGFLGVGNRKVAVDWSLLHFQPGDAKAVVTLNLTRAELQKAPEFKDSAHPEAMLLVPTAPGGAEAPAVKKP